MPSPLAHLRPTRTRATIGAVAAAAFLVGGVVALPGAGALGGAPRLAPPANPTSASQIQNIDRVKTAIKAYYGDTVTTEVDPVNGTTPLHEPSADSAWAKEATGVANQAKTYVRTHPNPVGAQPAAQGKAAKADAPRQKVLLLDVDDTSLVTYNYEIYSSFVYNPTQNAAFVNNASFPAVAGMVNLATYAENHGYQVFWLTGRPESQRAGTLENLTKVGFPGVESDHVFLKDLSNPIYSSCAAKPCSTIEYKSLTRKHIEDDLGYRIAVNMGDQASDLAGGYAKQTYKLPNPMYYLP